MKHEILKFEDKRFSIPVSILGDRSNKSCAWVFPGAGYNFMAPAFYYITSLLTKKGVTVLNLDYDFRGERQGLMNQEDYAEFFKFICDQALDLGLSPRKMAICKSVGSRILAKAPKGIFDKTIWPTPAISEDYVFNNILEQKDHALCIIGNKNPHFAQAKVDQLASANVWTSILENTDHGLDNQGSVSESIINIDQIILEVDDYLFFRGSQKSNGLKE